MQHIYVHKTNSLDVFFMRNVESASSLIEVPSLWSFDVIPQISLHHVAILMSCSCNTHPPWPPRPPPTGIIKVSCYFILSEQVMLASK